MDKYKPYGQSSALNKKIINEWMHSFILLMQCMMLRTVLKDSLNKIPTQTQTNLLLTFLPMGNLIFRILSLCASSI